MRVRWVVFASVLALFAASASAAADSEPSAHSIKITMQLEGSDGSVYVPGEGEHAVSSLFNSTYASPEHGYIASYAGGVFKSVIFVEKGFNSLIFARSGAGMHSLGLNMSLDGARAIFAFTRGDWNSVEKRIGEVESGKFFSYPEPTFGFGLGRIYAVKLLLRYTDIRILGNLTLQSGRQGISFYCNGTAPDNRQTVLVAQSP